MIAKTKARDPRKRPIVDDIAFAVRPIRMEVYRLLGLYRSRQKG